MSRHLHRWVAKVCLRMVRLMISRASVDPRVWRNVNLRRGLGLIEDHLVADIRRHS